MLNASVVLDNLQVFGFGIFFGMAFYCLFFAPAGWTAGLIANFVKKCFGKNHNHNRKNDETE